ncbi:MAG: nucleoside-diphosphate-sugar epimerase, partial [Pirellulaceae bacterium]
MSRITITGACGNLGWKLLCHLVQRSDVERIFGIALESPSEQQSDELRRLSGFEKATFAQGDLTDHTDRSWRGAVERSDAVVHFAAQNPYPEASWDDATKSLDMTLNIANAAASAGVKRFVFASSNHVMGRYKDSPLSETIGAGELTTDLDHAVGTVWKVGETNMDSTIYAVAKSSGERACRALALQSRGTTNFVCTRIGWCQPGENEPSTLSSAGTPTQDSTAAMDEDPE